MVLKVLIVKVYNMNNKSSTICFPSYTFLIIEFRGRHGRDRMVVGFPTTCASVPITTNVVSSNPVHGEVYPIQLYLACGGMLVFSCQLVFIHQYN